MNLLAIIFTLSVQLGVNSNLNFDYKAPTFHSMLENLDLIIRSEIISQTDTTINLKIEEILKGKLSKETLELRKFKDWPCASRHHKYQVGQKQINILRISKDGSYHGMSAGNEGELPLNSEFIYIKSWLNRESNYKSQFGRISGFRFNLTESINGLKRLIKLTETISSKEKDCSLLQLEPKSNIESMMIEENIMVMKLNYECENFENYDFKVINQKMYWY